MLTKIVFSLPKDDPPLMGCLNCPKMVKMHAKILNLEDETAFSQCVYALAGGGIVIAPTETSYGMLADASNPKAVEKVFRLKARDFTKPLSIFAFDMEMASKYAALTPLASRLAKKYLPGPLTLILEKKTPFKLANNLSKGKTIGIRISSHPAIIAITYNFNKPITATSANLSGAGEIYSSGIAIRDFAQVADIIIDGGNIPPFPPSTIVDCTGKTPKIVRQGAIKIKQ